MNVPGVRYVRQDVEAAMSSMHHGRRCFNKPSPLESSDVDLNTRYVSEVGGPHSSPVPSNHLLRKNSKNSTHCQAVDAMDQTNSQSYQYLSDVCQWILHVLLGRA